MAGIVGDGADDSAEAEHFESVGPPRAGTYPCPRRPDCEEDGEAQRGGPDEPIRPGARDDVGDERDGSGNDEGDEGREAMPDRKGLLLRQ